MKKKWIALAASFALLTGCGSDTASAKSASAASAAVSAAPAKSQNKSGESAVKKSEERIIRITAGSHVIHAKLYDNAAARAFWDKMPVTYSMQNLYNREMCFRMGAGSLPTKEAKDTGYKVADISYWPPMGSLVILYSQDSEVFEQQPIGHTDDDISFFANMGTTPIIFEKSEV